MAKASHKTARYRDGTSTRRCSLCTMWRPPDACTAVVKPIRPGGLCDYFKRAGKAGRNWYGSKED